ncbi:chromosome segregation protein SMC [Gallaecimonas sp. GXIMD4217]|uniref:chromosome segregation protein SMC n=1 Tax=Gallaecimonas sp. GXIMD4217 TaxID=3131927 RepID=UPI00311B144B
MAGFKSFVDPTTVPFPKAMTAILGPNGCGKSNVIDAVRWVLGESSAKNLRGDAMTDVIFNGSSGRKPVSQASVELVFDNSDGTAKGAYNQYGEIAVKRLVTRDGQSQYFLNGSRCRRRDITDIFLGTGLGPRSYAIIEQGMISRLIESKPQELRVFIEEAAGISKYKERRRETENRIRHTRDNLERLDDVREELGKQIDKLRRQADAARRYREYKASEREHKGLLAALRWRRHNDALQKLESEIRDLETDLEKFIAQSRGDDKAIIELKDAQHDRKDELEAAQSRYYRLGSDIARLEQSLTHASSRKQQLDEQIQRLQLRFEQAKETLAQDQLRQEEGAMQLEELQPELELLAEQLQEVRDRRQALEDRLNAARSAALDKERQQGQIRTQQQVLATRVEHGRAELARQQSALAALAGGDDQDELALLGEQRDEAAEALALAAQEQELDAEALAQCQAALDERKAMLRQRQEALRQAQRQEDECQARIQSLEALTESLTRDQDVDAALAGLGLADSPSLLDAIQIEPQWQQALEQVLGSWLSARIGTLPDGLGEAAVTLRLLEPGQGEAPQAGTLAGQIQSPVPLPWLNDIVLAESREQALAGRHELKRQQSFICPDGFWVGPNWVLTGPEGQNWLAQVQALHDARAALPTLSEARQEAERALAQANAALGEAEQALARGQDQLRRAEQQQHEARQALSLLEHQHQSLQQRLADKARQQAELRERLDEQRLQLELLEEERLALDERLMLLEEQELGRDDQSGLEDELARLRDQEQQLAGRYQQQAISLEGVRSRLAGLTESRRRAQEQLEEIQDQQQALREERLMLDDPGNDQREQLALWLEQHREVEQDLERINAELAQLDERLAALEEGQAAAFARVQAMQGEIDKRRLDGEGHKIRAEQAREQLDELDQALDDLLPRLSDAHSEEGLTRELERLGNAIGRLGAINLAAIEEFEQQSERKQYLDAQHGDLVEALETLESVIRKIDRETKARFKETFDQVNGDLQHLFPKVFGGGSAYLELTGEDLLDTGVTIMARPPGKRNSTIHLLSGGEKALTALSLVFAIFRLNPAPFCMLDEVDAPLDDANVERFCRLVREMSETVQFIYISHNKVSMEMADQLTGVTMHEPGVSRIVAVNIEEAVALAEAG